MVMVANILGHTFCVGNQWTDFNISYKQAKCIYSKYSNIILYTNIYKYVYI